MISLPTELPRTITRGFTISTKFLGPTNTRGSRVKATYKRDNERTWNATTHWNHAIDSEQNHFRAAQELLKSCSTISMRIGGFTSRASAQLMRLERLRSSPWAGIMSTTISWLLNNASLDRLTGGDWCCTILQNTATPAS